MESVKRMDKKNEKEGMTMQFLEWVRQQGNKVLITDNIKNANAVIRNVNRKAGMDIWHLSCKRLQDIVLELLTAYRAQQNILKPIKLMQPQAGVYLLNSLLLEEKYAFLPKECYCIKTTKTIYQSLQQLRANHTTVAYEAENEGKVADLKAMVCRYEERLQREGYHDEITLLKAGVKLLAGLKTREELLVLLPWCRQVCLADFADMEYTGLESDFLQHFLALLHQELTTLTYYEEGKLSPQVQYRFFKTYGPVNEVQYVVKQILERKLPLGEVNVFYTGDEYEPFIKGLFGKHNISYRFLTGESLQENLLMIFIQGVLRFAEEDYLYERLAEVIENPWMTLGKEKGEKSPSAVSSYNYFLKKGIGWGRERYVECIRRTCQDEETAEKYGRFLAFMDALLSIFEVERDCGALYGRLLEFVGEYTREGKERNLTLAILKEQRRILEQIEPQEDLSQTIALLREYLQDMEAKQEVATDAVNVIRIQNQEVLEREHNFLIGLSAKQFMADMNESPVLSDEQLKLYLEGKVLLAKENGSRIRENLVRTLATLDKGTVYMGYSTFDTLQLKEGAPSVFYLDCLEAWGQSEEVEVQKFEILQGPLHMTVPEEEMVESVESEEGKESEEEAGEADTTLSCEMSPSALQVLMECPLRYFYHYRKGLAERDFLQKKASEWLNPAKKGNLFHYTMEGYCKEVLMQPGGASAVPDEAAFNRIFEQKVQLILEEQPYVSRAVFEQEKTESGECCLRYITELQKELHAAAQTPAPWQILGCEVPFEALRYAVDTKMQGAEQVITINFNGTIDRLDGYVDGGGTLHLRIVDYKTGNFKKFEEALAEDKKLQHYIYAGAALELAKLEKEAFEARLQAKYEAVVIEVVQYDFPYENAVHFCAEEREKRFVLPQEVVKRLQGCMGRWLSGMEEEAYEHMKQEDMFVDEKEQCKYCTYGRICRRKLDELR